MRSSLSPRASLFLAVWLGSPGFVATRADAPADGASVLTQVQGTWEVVSLVRDGKPSAPEAIQGRLVVIEGDTFVDRTGEKVNGQGTLAFDPKAKPPAVDATFTAGFPKGKVSRGLYALDGDTLRACSSEAGGERPAEFSAPAGSKRFLVTYRRVKK